MSTKKGGKKGAIDDGQKQKDQKSQLRKLDTTGLKEQIFQLRQQMGYLIKQKSDVQSEMLKSNDKYMKDSFEIEKTIKIQEEELIDLENNYKLLKGTFEDNRRKNQVDWDNQLEVVARKSRQEKEVMNRKIGELQKKVNYLKEFKVREVDYLEQIRILRQKEENNNQSQKRDLQKIMHQHQGKRKGLRDNVEREIESIKDLQVNKLQQKMNKEQQMRRQNELIQDEIDLCENEKVVLEDEYKKLMEENQSNRSINGNSVLDGQATETYERSLRVIKLENKLGKLRIYMQQEVARLQNEYKQVVAEHQNARKEVESKIGKTQSWLKLKDKDFKKIKACAQMVLNQRSNLEAYLLQVFHQHSQLDYKDPANINQLLRYLFIKINSRKAPVTYKDYLLSTEQSQVSKKSL